MRLHSPSSSKTTRTFFSRPTSGHIEIAIALILIAAGVIWFLYNRSLGTVPHAAPYSSYVNDTTSSQAWGGIPFGIVSVAALSLYGMGVLTGLFMPLLRGIKQQHDKRPFSFSCLLPTKANKAIVFLDGLQKMRDAGFISKQEYETKRTNFLSKL